MVDEVVMDRFRLLERIGSGGMGTVYRAFDERLQRHVAVKDVDAADAGRVLREAQAAARLNHPGIVTLYELGQRGNRALLVSELVPGSTLAALRSCGELNDREVAEIGADLCEAIAHAHAHGVVHRDLKPENVIVREHGGPHRAKLMDFGIARIAGAPTVTATGNVVGTLAYMSPEQAEGLEAHGQSDVYSLALTLYECWAGENPVAGENPADTARRIGAGVPSLAEYRPDLPEPLIDAIDACLDPNPLARPGALELRACLGAELDLLDGSRALPAPDGAPEPPGAPEGLSLIRLGVLLAGCALLGLLAGPLGAPGLALVLFVLAGPLLALGLPAESALVVSAPALAAVGLGPATAAVGAFGRSPATRAVLGASAWTWMFATAIATGAGTTAGIADPAPSGWSSDASTAIDSVLGGLLTPEALLGALAFAAAAAVLGWVLSARHAPIALLGAMLWAAGVEAVLRTLGDGALGRQPAIVVAAAAVAVAVEFRFLRGPARAEGDSDPHHPRADRLAAI
ncbi:MAG: protein kinase domain-containing protein [Solirubrobacterales bacterium]